MPGGEHIVVNGELALLFLGYIVGTVTLSVLPYCKNEGERGSRPMIHNSWYGDDCCLPVSVVHVPVV